jgi:hypothetical protein
LVRSGLRGLVNERPSIYDKLEEVVELRRALRRVNIGRKGLGRAKKDLPRSNRTI